MLFLESHIFFFKSKFAICVSILIIETVACILSFVIKVNSKTVINYYPIGSNSPPNFQEKLMSFCFVFSFRYFFFMKYCVTFN